MESPTNMMSSFDVQRQLSCFVSLNDDDEMAQLILEELSFPRRSYMNVAAALASSPSSKKAENGLNSITESDHEEEEEDDE